MYNPYQYQQQPQATQQNFMQPWLQQNQPQPQWQQPIQQIQMPQPEPQSVQAVPQMSDVAQAIHRLCDILEAQRGGQGNA